MKFPRSLAVAALLTPIMLLQTSVAVGQKEKEELKNRVTAYIDRGATDKDGVVTLWLSNVNPLAGMTLPFKFAPGSDSIILDSVHNSVGRAATFRGPPPKYRQENQTYLQNLLIPIDSAGADLDPIPPGEGLLMRLFFSSETQFPLKRFEMAAVQLPPQNRLLYVTDIARTVLPEFVLVHGPAPVWPPVAEEPKEKAKSKTP